MAAESDRGDIVRRRARSVPAVALAAVTLTALVVPLVALTALADLATARVRLPRTRLLLFAICWAWLETAGLVAAALLWCTGRRADVAAHYRLQRWWADRLMRALRATCGVHIEVDGVEALRPGPIVLLVRHASLADSLLTAWVVTEQAGLRPRVVLKRELLADPCLDVVGNRLPNCFVDRAAEDSAPGLAAIADMASGMTADDVAIIFPEGTRANDAKRRRTLEKLAQHDPERAERVAELRHLLPPRPAGTRALLGGAPDADVVLGWHVGFDGLDTFGGIIAALSRRRISVRMRFVRLGAPPAIDGEFDRWLDSTWLRLDREVTALTDES